MKNILVFEIFIDENTIIRANTKDSYETIDIYDGDMNLFSCQNGSTYVKNDSIENYFTNINDNMKPSIKESLDIIWDACRDSFIVQDNITSSLRYFLELRNIKKMDRFYIANEYDIVIKNGCSKIKEKPVNYNRLFGDYKHRTKDYKYKSKEFVLEWLLNYRLEKIKKRLICKNIFNGVILHKYITITTKENENGN